MKERSPQNISVNWNQEIKQAKLSIH